MHSSPTPVSLTQPHLHSVLFGQFPEEIQVFSSTEGARKLRNLGREVLSHHLPYLLLQPLFLPYTSDLQLFVVLEPSILLMERVFLLLCPMTACLSSRRNSPSLVFPQRHLFSVTFSRLRNSMWLSLGEWTSTGHLDFELPVGEPEFPYWVHRSTQVTMGRKEGRKEKQKEKSF